MFKPTSPPNPYDDLVLKATSEDLIAEDWETNLLICDKVSEDTDGEEGANKVVAAVMKRLGHRNPNVQLFALELANSLAQNCGKPLQLELGSRAFTGTLDRLINDRTTNPKIKQRALHFVKMWRDEFGHDPASGTINELYEGLKAKGIVFDDKVKQGSGSGSGGRGGGGGGGAGGESDAERRTREEEEELQRVLELSKQDKGGRGTSSANTQSTGVGSSSSGTGSSSQPQALTASPNPGGPGGTATTTTISSPGPKPFPAHTHEPTPAPLPSKETASRVRAIYPFVTSEKGELAFEKDQVIKVIDRMYDEWYTGAVGGRIGIFPISYVEPLPDPTPEELAREAQEEARVFAAQGMIMHLQRLLDGLDPSHGDRVDTEEIDEIYQKTVALQPQIVALMKKYADQRAELEHIHAGFVKASRQYLQMTQPQQQPVGYDPRYAAQPTAAAAGAPPPGANTNMSEDEQRKAAEQHAAAWQAYWAQQAAAQQAMGGGGAQQQSQPQQQAQATTSESQLQSTQPPAQSEEEQQKIAAAWQAYYASMGYSAGQPQGQELPSSSSPHPHPDLQHQHSSQYQQQQQQQQHQHSGSSPSHGAGAGGYQGPAAAAAAAASPYDGQPSSTYGGGYVGSPQPQHQPQHQKPQQAGVTGYYDSQQQHQPHQQQQQGGAPPAMTGLERQVDNLSVQ